MTINMKNTVGRLLTTPVNIVNSVYDKKTEKLLILLQNEKKVPDKLNFVSMYI